MLKAIFFTAHFIQAENFYISKRKYEMCRNKNCLSLLTHVYPDAQLVLFLVLESYLLIVDVFNLFG